MGKDEIRTIGYITCLVQSIPIIVDLSIQAFANGYAILKDWQAIMLLGVFILYLILTITKEKSHVD